MIEQHDIGVVFGGRGADLVGLAAADKKTGIGTIAPAADARNRYGARGTRERTELQYVFGIGRCAYAKAHEYGTLTCAWSLEHSGLSRRLRTGVQAQDSLACDRLDRRAVFVGDAHVARRDNRRNRVFVDHLRHAVLE